MLHHGQTALAFELSRRRAVSAAELRLAGDLLEDLEGERLDERETGRRMAAFGLEPAEATPRSSRRRATGRAASRSAARSPRSSTAPVRYLSTARRDRAAFLVEAASEDEILGLAEKIVKAGPHARVGVGRPAQGRALGRSLLEARAALDAADGDVASYRDLGSLELLLSLPDAALEAFVDRVLGPAAETSG